MLIPLLSPHTLQLGKVLPISPNVNEGERKEMTERSLLMCLCDHSTGVSGCNNITLGCRTLCWDSLLSGGLALGKHIPRAQVLVEER